MILFVKPNTPRVLHCVKSAQIRSFSGSNFPAFGLNTETYSVSLRIQYECVKIRTRKNSVFGHILRSALSSYTHCSSSKFHCIFLWIFYETVVVDSYVSVNVKLNRYKIHFQLYSRLYRNNNNNNNGNSKIMKSYSTLQISLQQDLQRTTSKMRTYNGF